MLILNLQGCIKGIILPGYIHRDLINHYKDRYKTASIMEVRPGFFRDSLGVIHNPPGLGHTHHHPGWPRPPGLTI